MADEILMSTGETYDEWHRRLVKQGDADERPYIATVCNYATPEEERASVYYCPRRAGKQQTCADCSFEHGLPPDWKQPCRRWEE